jgi:hypothetical protein
LFLAGLAVCWFCCAALAFPPAPHHLFYGMVRNEMGNPLAVTDAEVILETLAGTQLKARVVPNLRPGINYRLAVPMDAGLTADDYKPTALRPTVPFRMKVKIGQVTYLPIELHGNYANLGKPAQSTRLDLTLGEDADGDGLPDAWERALIAVYGGTLQDIKPGDDADGDGLTNMEEYLAGTYAFDPQDGFQLDILGMSDGRPVLEFMAIRGRSYTLEGTADLQTWSPVQFRLAGADATAPALTTYTAADVRLLRIEALQPDGAPAKMRLFRLLVQ